MPVDFAIKVRALLYL